MNIASEKQKVLQDDNIKKAFETLDIDKDGSLTIGELQQAFQSDGSEKSIEFWKDFIKEADKDGNEEISFEEFKDAMLTLLK